MKLSVKQLRRLIREVSEPTTASWRMLIDVIDFLAEETDDFSNVWADKQAPRNYARLVFDTFGFSGRDAKSLYSTSVSYRNAVSQYVSRMTDSDDETETSYDYNMDAIKAQKFIQEVMWKLNDLAEEIPGKTF